MTKAPHALCSPLFSVLHLPSGASSHKKLLFFPSSREQILIFLPRHGMLEVKSSVFKEQQGSEYSSVPMVR